MFRGEDRHPEGHPGASGWRTMQISTINNRYALPFQGSYVAKNIVQGKDYKIEIF